jgi:hypothetical protein
MISEVSAIFPFVKPPVLANQIPLHDFIPPIHLSQHAFKNEMEKIKALINHGLTLCGGNIVKPAEKDPLVLGLPRR